jgi:DNA mismatch repair protein MutS
LAGIPDKVIRRAKEILKNLEEHEISARGKTASLLKKVEQTSPQVELFEVLMDKAQETDPVIDEIKNLQMEALSPIQAWQTLKALQDKLEK